MPSLEDLFTIALFVFLGGGALLFVVVAVLIPVHAIWMGRFAAKLQRDAETARPFSEAIGAQLEQRLGAVRGSRDEGGWRLDGDLTRVIVRVGVPPDHMVIECEPIVEPETDFSAPEAQWERRGPTLQPERGWDADLVAALAAAVRRLPAAQVRAAWASPPSLHVEVDIDPTTEPPKRVVDVIERLLEPARAMHRDLLDFDARRTAQPDVGLADADPNDSAPRGPFR